MTIQGILLAAAVLGLAAWLYSVRWAKREMSPRRRFILLAIRVAFLITLIVLWYRPTVARVRYEEQPPHVAVVLDDSDSMNIEDMPPAGEDGPPVSRAWWAQDAVFNADHGLVPRLQDRDYRITVHAMNTGRVLKRATAYRANQNRSDLTAALRDLASPRRAARPDAFILVTDGAENTQPEPALAGIEGIPVHTLGVGDPAPQADLRLEGVSLPRNIFREEPVEALVTVVRSGDTPDVFGLRIVDGEEVLEDRAVRFEEGEDRSVVPIDLQFEEAGEHTLTFEVTTEAPERITRNNQTSERVLVLKDKHQIVGLLGAPSLETKYLFRALQEDIRLETRLLYLLPQGVLLDPNRTGEDKVTTREALGQVIAGADLIVAADLGDSGLTEADAQRLYSYVAEEGGSLLWLGGPRAFGPVVADTQLGRLFPFAVPRGARGRPEQSQVQVTPAGLRAPGFEALAQVGANRLPPLSGLIEPGDVHPGSRVLLRARDAAGEMEGAPVYLVQRYGLGNLAVLLGSGTWRWQATFADAPEDDPRSTIHSRFWQGVIHGFFASPSTGDLRLEANGTAFDVHETVTVWTWLDEQTAAWYDKANIQGTLTHADGQEIRIPLSRSANNPALYEGRFSLASPGAYEFTAEVGERKGSLHLTVRASGEEFALLNQQRETLETLAERTGGEYFTTENWTSIPRALDLEAEEVARRSRVFLGQLPEIVLLVIALAVAEWILRRRWSLP